MTSCIEEDAIWAKPVALAAGELKESEELNIRGNHGRSEQYKHKYLVTEVIAE